MAFLPAIIGQALPYQSTNARGFGFILVPGVTDTRLSLSDAAQWSLSSSVAIAFHKTRMAGYPAAVNAARQADRYAEAGTLHVAAFGTAREQLSLAVFVIQQLRTSKNLNVYGGG